MKNFTISAIVVAPHWSVIHFSWFSGENRKSFKP